MMHDKVGGCQDRLNTRSLGPSANEF
jgi:hypothetical protein